MSDKPFYAPNAKPLPPRVPRPGEPLVLVQMVTSQNTSPATIPQGIAIAPETSPNRTSLAKLLREFPGLSGPSLRVAVNHPLISMDVFSLRSVGLDV